MTIIEHMVKGISTDLPKSDVAPTRYGCDELAKAVIGDSRVDLDGHTEQVKECVTKYWNPDDIDGFRLFTQEYILFEKKYYEGELKGPESAELATDDVNVFSTYYYLHDQLSNPKPGTKYLAEKIQDLDSGKEIRVYLDPVDDLGIADASVSLRDGVVHLYDTMGIGRAYKGTVGRMEGLTRSYYDPSTFNHELGHRLMYLVYGEDFPFYKGVGHDLREVDFAEQRSSEGAAWSEGFAHVAGALDGVSHHASQSDFFGSEWREASTSEKLSNEWAVSAVLYDFIERKGPDGCYSADLTAFKKVVGVMQETRTHQSFAEFIVDYCKKYPDERARFERVLKHISFTDQDIEAIFKTPPK